MSPLLVPCPACRRHVRAEECACPFCGGDVPRGVVAPPSPPAGLGRRMMAVFAASAALGCGSQQALYGAPPPPDATGDATDSAVVDTGATDTGAVDTGVSDGTVDATDTGTPGNLYGAPPVDTGPG